MSKGFNTVADDIAAEKWPTEKPHPLRKVPGFPKRATWSKYQGRWVIPALHRKD